MRINNQQNAFNVLNALKFLGDMKECSFLEITNEFLNVQELLKHTVNDDDFKVENDVEE